MTRLCLVALAALLGGCSPLIGFLIRVGQSESSEIRAGETVSGTTRGANDDFTPACGAPSGGGDREYVFVPETTGVYRVDLNGEYDCVVAVFDEAGESVACNDDSGSTTHSMVEPRLEAGRRYTIVVDGYRANTGSYTLRLTAPSAAPAGDAAALALDERREGDTTDRSDTRTPPCGATPGSPDQTWTFEAAEAGAYAFEVDSTYDGVVAVYAAGASTPLACNDDHGSTRASRVVAELTAGQLVEVVVDGYRGAAGAYGVVVRREGEPSGPPPSGQPLALGAPTRGDTRRGTDRVNPGCGSRPGTRDETWTFTPPTTGAYQIHVDAEYDSVLAIYEGGAAEPMTCNDDFGTTRRSRITTTLEAGRSYAIVVDGYGVNAGAYMIAVTAITSSGGGTLALNQVVTGNTAAGSDHFTPACGSQPGTNDEVWTFVVPSTGQYRIRVDAEYDSVLGILDAQNQPIGCNDDHGGTRTSQVDTALNAGDTVRVVVDGFHGQTGSYRLQVQPLTAGGGAPATPATPAVTALRQRVIVRPRGPAVEDITAMEAACPGAPLLSAGLTSGRVVAADGIATTRCGGGAGGDAIYRVEVPAPTTLTVTAESLLMPVLELRDACSRGHTVLACAMGSRPAQRASLTARLEAGRTYYLVVDTRGRDDATFTLETTLTPLREPPASLEE